MKSRKQILLFTYILFDFLAASLAWAVLYSFRKFKIENYDFNIEMLFEDRMFFLGIILVPIFWVISYFITGSYYQIYRKSRLKVLKNTFILTLIGATFLFFTLLLDDQITKYQNYYQSFLVLLSSHFLLTGISRVIVLNISKSQLRRSKVGFNTLMVGSNRKAIDLYQELTGKSYSLGYNFKGFIEVDEESVNGLSSFLPKLGTIDDLSKVLEEKEIEEVVISLEEVEHEHSQRILNEVAGKGVIVKIIPSMYDLISGSVGVNQVTGATLIEIYPDIMPRLERNLKRFIDVLVSAIFLILLIPLYIYIAIMVRLSSKGPVFFVQERIGLRGKPFNIIKFRSMIQDAEKDGPALSSTNDSRITKWGKTMRKLRLDELPQFLNVLKGDMSLVGPRPERRYFIERIAQSAPHIKHLTRVKPGITSMGMIKYGYAENVEEMIERLKYDIIYIENASLGLDLKIMIYTVLIIFQGKGK